MPPPIEYNNDHCQKMHRRAPTSEPLILRLLTELTERRDGCRSDSNAVDGLNTEANSCRAKRVGFNGSPPTYVSRCPTT